MDQGSGVPEEEKEEDENYPSELKEQDIKIITLLEDFVSTKEFTGSLNTFIDEHCMKFHPVDDDEEQDLELYALYRQFKKLVEE